MTYVKRIVCLANSTKIGGSCIAGREVLADGKFGSWIRPISSRSTAEVSHAECKYSDNSVPKLLDVIDIPLTRAVPHNHQTENHVIDVTRPWAKKGQFPWSDLEQLRERPESLWINSDHTINGTFNCISQAEATTLQSSLVLIKKSKFIVEIGSKTWNERTTRTHRGKFKYKGIDYSLNLTDPVAIAAFAAKSNGDYELNEVYLCLSLTEPWEKDNNRCHKLVAAVIKNPQL